MTESEVLEKHKKCLIESNVCEDRDCFSCELLVDDDELLEALDKAIEILK